MPTHDDAKTLTVTLDADLLAALDRFIAELHPDASRESVAAVALRDWAGQHGYIGPHGTIRPEDLNASNDD